MFSALTSVFITALLTANIIASKIAAFGPVYLPAAVIVFPIAYITGDIITEVYGYAAMRRCIWIGFLCNLLSTVVYTCARLLPAAPFYAEQSAFDSIFAAVPRILFASFVAYLIGSFLNAFILATLKIQTNGRHLWLRTIGSTIVGEGVDSVVFIGIAFAGTMPNSTLGTLLLMQWLWKCGFEILFTPFTYAIVITIKRLEGIDHFDRTTNFQPFSL